MSQYRAHARAMFAILRRPLLRKVRTVANTQLFTTEQAAAYLDGIVSVQTLINWRCTKRYDLPFVRVGRRIAYRKADLDAFVESRTVRQSDPTLGSERVGG